MTTPAGGEERTEVAILANPLAGSGGRRGRVNALVAALRRNHLDARVCRTPPELSDLVGARATSLRCVVAAGGDGTLREVLNRAPGLPVAVLPAGNENLMARYLGIPPSGPELAATIAAGRTRRFDLIRVAGRLVSLMVSAGFDAEVVHRVHRGRRGHIGKLDYARAILAGVLSYRFAPLSVTVAETGERLHGHAAFVFNLPRYGLGLPIAPRARPDDGLLDLYVFHMPGAWHLLCTLGAIVRGRHERRGGVSYRRVRGVRLTADEPVPLQADGDEAGYLPVDLDVVPAAARLVVPAGHGVAGTLAP